MLCQLSDYKVHYNQADQYWPDAINPVLEIKNAELSVKFIKEEKLEQDLVQRTF
jgi:hypothetical protein